MTLLDTGNNLIVAGKISRFRTSEADMSSRYRPTSRPADRFRPGQLTVLPKSKEGRKVERLLGSWAEISSREEVPLVLDCDCCCVLRHLD